MELGVWCADVNRINVLPSFTFINVRSRRRREKVRLARAVRPRFRRLVLLQDKGTPTCCLLPARMLPCTLGNAIVVVTGCDTPSEL
jgi:hypothetical protein